MIVINENKVTGWTKDGLTPKIQAESLKKPFGIFRGAACFGRKWLFGVRVS